MPGFFCCKQFRDLCFRWGVAHITTTPYYPQASLAERVNRILTSALKIFYHASQSEWDAYLPWLGLVFNTAVHESAKCTPISYFWAGSYDVHYQLNGVYAPKVRMVPGK